MMFSRLWILLLGCWLSVLAASNPLPFSGATPNHRDGDSERIRVQRLYRNISLNDVPTTVADDVVLTNYSITRYGYHMGRPVSRIIRNPIGRILTPLLGRFMTDMPFIQHWGVLISTESPHPYNTTSRLPHSGSKVPRPESGLIYELRNSANTKLVYLDVKNWSTYSWRDPTMRYLGTLNKTDEELIMIGRAYMQHIGKEGFHNFYRNCQHFTTWYSKALWPKVTLTQRADQIFGKALWWLKDVKKTAKWGLNKIGGWLGFPVARTEEVDSAAEFVKLEDVLNGQKNASTTDIEEEDHIGSD